MLSFTVNVFVQSISLAEVIETIWINDETIGLSALDRIDEF